MAQNKPDGEDEVKMTNEDKVAVKRFEPCIRMEHFGDMQDYADMREFVSGGYVLYFDYDKLEKALAEKDTIISGLNKELEIAWDKRKNYASEADDIKAQLAEKDKRIEKLEGELDDIYVRKECREIAEDIDKVEMMAKKIAELEQKVAELEDHLDLMADEFQRIKVIGSDEIQWICKRAVENTVQKVPMIKQRDLLEAQCSKMRVALETAYHGIRAFASYGRGASLGVNGIDEPNLERAHSACEQALSDGGVE